MMEAITPLKADPTDQNIIIIVGGESWRPGPQMAKRIMASYRVSRRDAKPPVDEPERYEHPEDVVHRSQVMALAHVISLDPLSATMSETNKDAFDYARDILGDMEIPDMATKHGWVFTADLLDFVSEWEPPCYKRQPIANA